MRALDRKLLREAWRLRGQLLSIALVVATGIMTVVTMRGTYRSLRAATDDYYREYRMADVWARLKRAPVTLKSRIEQIPGVAAVETRVTFAAMLDLPRLPAPAMGLFLSIPDQRRPMLNDIHLTSGRYPAAGRADEAVVSEKFALANGFTTDSSVQAVINGRRRALRIVGTAISPEHSYAVPPGSLYPEDERYGILWMSERVLGPAYDMEGAFNEVALSLGPGVERAGVLARLDDLLEPYGGLGAYDRSEQLSAKILADELEQNRVMGTVIPAIFLGVAAFLLHMVLGRLIATQRTEVAVLKAFGYSDREVGWHYLLFTMMAVVPGALLGIVLGIALGHSMLDLYSEYFNFPALVYQAGWRVVAVGVGVSVLAAVVGALAAVRRVMDLPPAEAMRPEPPARFKAGWVERAGVGRILPAAGRMILRNVERQPVRTLLSAVGVAFSVAILVIGMFMFDGVDHMMALQFRVGQREDLSMVFNQPLPDRVQYELTGLPGVRRAEMFRSLAVRLSSGPHHRDLGVTGVAPGTSLRRIVTAHGGVQPLPPEGIVLSAVIARDLQVRPGEPVAIEFLEGRRRSGEVTVSGVVEDFLGVSAFMDLDALRRLADEGPMVSGAYLRVDPDAMAGLNAALKQMPSVASVASPAQMLASFEEQIAQSLLVAVGFLLAFSGIIAVAVIYNGARLALSERGRELASLRVLGFHRREVAVLLLGEQAIITALAIPLGWGLGYLMAALISASLQSETYRIPLVVSSRTYLWSAVIVALAAVLSGALVRRRLNNLDLMAVLKTRE